MGDKPCSMCLQLKGASFKVALTRWTTLTTWFWGADTKTSTTDIVWRNGFGSKLYFSWAGNILKWSHIYVQVARFPHEKTKVKISDSAGFTYFTGDTETFQRCTLTLILKFAWQLGIVQILEVIPLLIWGLLCGWRCGGFGWRGDGLKSKQCKKWMFGLGILFHAIIIPGAMWWRSCLAAHDWGQSWHLF